MSMPGFPLRARDGSVQRTIIDIVLPALPCVALTLPGIPERGLLYGRGSDQRNVPWRESSS